MQESKNHLNTFFIFFSCFLVILSFFLPWQNFVFSWFSAFDICRGLFKNKPSLIEKGMVIFLIFPIIAIVQFYIEKVTRTDRHCGFYFTNGTIIIIAAFYYSSITDLSLGSLFAISGGILLCVTSLKIRIKM